MVQTTDASMAPETLLQINVVTGADIAPDGSRIAFAVQEAVLDENRYRSAIWIIDAVSGEARQFTSGTSLDREPRWTPDGNSLAFISDRSGTPQIYLIDADGGESRQVTHLERGASGIRWSPDGTRIAFLTTEGTGISDEERTKPDGVIRHITARQYRFDGTGYIDGRFPHVWFVDLATGDCQQVTSGAQADSSPAWSPDSRQIAFVSNRQDESSIGHTSQLYVVDVPVPGIDISDDDGARQIPSDAAMHTEPGWSPDGTTIAFIGHRKGARAGANYDVFTVPADGSNTGRRLTVDFDRGTGLGNFSDTFDGGAPSIFWTSDGNTIRFSVNDHGRVGLFSVTMEGNVSRLIGGDRTAAMFTQSADGSRIAFVASTFTNPCDVFISAADGSDERQLTTLNRKLLSELPIQQPEHLPFRSFDDQFDVDAWLIRPAGFDPEQSYPLVQIIHGGPHSVFGHVFFFDMQLWASQGWNVLFVNPRATQSYGEAFAVACIGDWGGADWREQEQALDLAIEQGGVDSGRLAVTGLSYGGFMTNWIVGQTDRYRVAVSENSISNLVSFMFTSDIGWHFLEEEMERELWSNMDWYMQLSPISCVPSVTTPVLLLQSETDWRCPVEQGEQFYQALKQRGIDTEMVRFPGENHVALRNGKPESRLSRRQHTVRWFKKYL